MSDYIPSAVRVLVERRARNSCEYCLIHSDDALLPHEPDHIVATKHRGVTHESNLGLACFLCNRHKGSDIASIDVETGLMVRLYNPRQDTWADHFHLEDGRIIPLTDVGRVTEHLLKLNLPDNVELRKLLSAANRYPRIRHNPTAAQ